MTQRKMTIDDFRAVLEEVLEESGLKVRPETEAKDIANWDSLNHVRLLIWIEKTYGIEFPIDEVEKARNVGELLGIINRLLAK